LSDISRPNVGVVTNIGPVHLERLGSLGAIVAAKAELVEALPADGLAVLNGDDARTAALAARTSAPVLLYGQSEQCDVRASDVVSRGLEGMSFELSYEGSSEGVTCPLPGKHHVYPALAAAAAGLNDGMSLAEVGDALGAARPELLSRVLAGLNGSTILDDSYNASPASMLAALELLRELPGRRIALLGEMRELGGAADEGHRIVGEVAASACGTLLVVGEGARLIEQAAREAGLADVRWMESTGDAIDLLRGGVRAGDHLLVKGSRAVALEEVADALAAR